MKSSAGIAYTGILALLSGTFIASQMMPNRNPEPLRVPLDNIATELAGWKMGAVEEISPGQLTATSYLARTYIKEDQQLALLVAYHDTHQAGVSVHTPKNCLPGGGWEIWKPGYATVVFDGRPVVINRYYISRSDRRMAVLYWYQSRGRVIANEYLAKLMLVRDALIESRTSGSFIRIVMADNPAWMPEGFRFAEAIMHQLQRCFVP